MSDASIFFRLINPLFSFTAKHLKKPILCIHQASARIVESSEKGLGGMNKTFLQLTFLIRNNSEKEIKNIKIKVMPLCENRSSNPIACNETERQLTNSLMSGELFPIDLDLENHLTKAREVLSFHIMINYDDYIWKFQRKHERKLSYSLNKETMRLQPV